MAMTNLEAACVASSREAIFWDRWADSQCDTSLEVVDRALAEMARYAGLSRDANPDIAQAALYEMENLSFSLVLRLRKLFALDPLRRTHLPFAVGEALCDVVWMAVPSMDVRVRRAILAGVEMAEASQTDLVPADQLSDLELAYRDWACPRLLEHMLGTTTAFLG